MKTTVSFFLAFFALAITSVAEKAPEKRGDATHIIVGTVSNIYKANDGDYTSYIVLIKIDKVEKGKGHKAGEFLYASCFKRKALRVTRPLPGASGHRSVPARGEMIRAFINKSGGLMEGVYPDWYDSLAEKS